MKMTSHQFIHVLVDVLSHDLFRFNDTRLKCRCGQSNRNQLGIRNKVGSKVCVCGFIVNQHFTLKNEPYHQPYLDYNNPLNNGSPQPILKNTSFPSSRYDFDHHLIAAKLKNIVDAIIVRNDHKSLWIIMRSLLTTNITFIDVYQKFVLRCIAFAAWKLEGIGVVDKMVEMMIEHERIDFNGSIYTWIQRNESIFLKLAPLHAILSFVYCFEMKKCGHVVTEIYEFGCGGIFTRVGDGGVVETVPHTILRGEGRDERNEPDFSLLWNRFEKYGSGGTSSVSEEERKRQVRLILFFFDQIETHIST
jgi:hypothetical protein